MIQFVKRKQYFLFLDYEKNKSHEKVARNRVNGRSYLKRLSKISSKINYDISDLLGHKFQ